MPEASFKRGWASLLCQASTKGRLPGAEKMIIYILGNVFSEETKAKLKQVGETFANIIV